MRGLKFFILVLGLSGWLFQPLGAWAQTTTTTATTTTTTANPDPFLSPQGVMARALFSGLLGASAELKTPGFSPIVNAALVTFFSSSFGPNFRPVFLQNADFGGFISGLKTQTPTQLGRLFTRDIFGGGSSQGSSTGGSEPISSSTQTDSDTNFYNAPFLNNSNSQPR